MNTIITGIDDATKCPCIGSIFIAGVTATHDTIHTWKELGVNDSKLVAPQKRIELAETIKKTAITYSIRDVTPAMCDDKSSFNLNDWEMLIVFRILNDLQRKSELGSVYIDNWDVSLERFNTRFNHLLSTPMKDSLVSNGIRVNRSKLKSLTLVPEHYADENHTVVGAASILAKVASEQQYKKFKRLYGDFGSGSPGDPKTRQYVWEHRHNPPPIIRQSWNTFKTLSVIDRIEDDPLFVSVRRKHPKISTTNT